MYMVESTPVTQKIHGFYLCTCNLLVYPEVIVSLIGKKGFLLNFDR